MSEPGEGDPFVTVSIFLFGKPAWEIDRLEGQPVDLELLDEIASCGRELRIRLARAADLGKKLVEKGWEGVGLLYDIEFSKAVSLTEAKDELRAIGVEPDEVSVREEFEDSEEEPYGE